MSKIKNCPFCGADEGFLTIMVADVDVCFVQCCNCGGASGTCATSQEAIETWNTRTTEKGGVKE